MDDNAQFERIFNELESIRAQLRSMAESSGSNTGLVMQEITGLKAWREGHERRIDMLVEQGAERNAFVDGQIKELVAWQGRCDARLLSLTKQEDFKPVKDKVEDMDRVHEQAKGMRKVWIAAASILGVALVVANLVHMLGGR